MEAIAVLPPYLTDAEVDELCAGLTQSAAKCRYLERDLKVPVRRKPNGRPLVMRADVEAMAAARARGVEAQNVTRGPNVVGLDQWSKGRKRGT
jgi:hypothetical protein